MLASDGRGHGKSLVGTLRGVQQEPVPLIVPLDTDLVAAADEIPTVVAFTVDGLGLREGKLLPAADLRGHGDIVGLALGFEFGIKDFAQLDAVHVVDRNARGHPCCLPSSVTAPAAYSRFQMWSGRDCPH